MLPTTALANDYSDLLDVEPANDNHELAPANDVDARRAELRAVAPLTMQASLAADSEDNLFAGLTYEVAAGGVFVATYDPPAVGARVEVTVTLPGDRGLVLHGIVRFIRDAELAGDGIPAGVGIEWKGLPVEAARALDEFATTREPLLYLPDAAA